MLFKILILLFISNVIANLYNNSNSWILNSRFNYKYPNDSILNLAYPSAIAQYYVTIVPPYSNYLFIGQFLVDNVFESSLTVYNGNGSLNNNYPSINNYNTNSINITIDNNSTNLLFVFQRFYVNMNYYDKNDLIDNLCQVIDLKNKINLPKLDKYKRDINSLLLDNPLQRIVTKFSPLSTHYCSKFYLPNQNVNGLFPDSNHYYLFSNLGRYDIIKISGLFIPSKITPYMDFITVDESTTQTNYGIPFYELPNQYQFYIISPYTSINDLEKYNITNEKIISWKKDNKLPAVIFRLTDYSKNGISNLTGPLNSYETKKYMNYGFYPEINIISI